MTRANSEIDFDFDSHLAAAELAGDALTVIVFGGFPVVTHPAELLPGKAPGLGQPPS